MKKTVSYAIAFWASASLLGGCAPDEICERGKGPLVIVEFEPITFTSIGTKADDEEVVEFTVPASMYDDLIVVPRESNQYILQTLPSFEDSCAFDGGDWALKDSVEYQAVAMNHEYSPGYSLDSFFSVPEMPDMKNAYVASDYVKADNGVIHFTLKPRFSIIHLILDLNKPTPDRVVRWWDWEDNLFVNGEPLTSNPFNYIIGAGLPVVYKYCANLKDIVSATKIESYLAVDATVNNIEGIPFECVLKGDNNSYAGSFTGIKMEPGKIYTIHVEMIKKEKEK